MFGPVVEKNHKQSCESDIIEDWDSSERGCSERAEDERVPDSGPRLAAKTIKCVYFLETG